MVAPIYSSVRENVYAFVHSIFAERLRAQETAIRLAENNFYRDRPRTRVIARM